MDQALRPVPTGRISGLIVNPSPVYVYCDPSTKWPAEGTGPLDMHNKKLSPERTLA